MPAAASHAAMRPFGAATDLDLDFTQDDRAALVTAVLERCAHPDASYWWSQEVGARTAALLRLLGVTERRDAYAMQSRCRGPACGEAFEFELPLQALLAPAPGNAPARVQLDGGRAVTLRRPKGDDLRRWREVRPPSRADAVRLMLETLVVEGDVESADEAAVAAAIAALDPLVDCSVSCRCPACGTPAEVEVDLEAFVLGRLAARQSALLHEVHRLAGHYGWTESEVLEIPSARRARYLAFIEEGR